MRKLILLTTLTVFLTTGCGEVVDYVQSKINKGNHKGVAACIKINKNDLVSIETVRRACTKSHEKLLSVYGVSFGKNPWRGSFSKWGEKWNVSVAGANQLKTHIITSFVVKVEVFDPEGKSRKRLMSFEGLWLEPLKKFSKSKSFDFGPEDKMNKWCNDLFTQSTDYKSCKTWGITEIKGILIAID